MASRVKARCEQALHESGAPRNIPHLAGVDSRFLDGETRVRLEGDVRGGDVFLFQNLRDPTSTRLVDQNLVALLAAIRTCREWGARQVTAVVPYLAYARQDKPTRSRREPTTARLIADLLTTAGLDRLVTWHPHFDQIRGFYGAVPVEALDPLVLFRDAFEHLGGSDDTIAVAPDIGAAKLIDAFGRIMGLKTALAAKHRPRPEEAAVSDVLGDLSDKRKAIILDDMIASGGTVTAVVEKLVREHGIEEVHLGVSHNLCIERCHDQLVKLHAAYGLAEVVVTDTVPQSEPFLSLPFLSVTSVAGAVAEVIDRVHFDRATNATRDVVPRPPAEPLLEPASDEELPLHLPSEAEVLIDETVRSVQRSGRKGGPPLRESLSVVPEDLPHRILEDATKDR
jgi:ribose-phosphate pyrophosphokinase